jgi:hypothetical protein
MVQDVFDTMDAWLTAIAADAAPGTKAEKVARNRPAGLTDACFKADGTRIAEPGAFQSSSACTAITPPHGDPRIAAGAPLANDVLKCQLKPISTSDYTQPLTPAQLQRLQAVFPDGVCDYTKPGVQQQKPIGPWLSFPTPGQMVPVQ